MAWTGGGGVGAADAFPHCEDAGACGGVGHVVYGVGEGDRREASAQRADLQAPSGEVGEVAGEGGGVRRERLEAGGGAPGGEVGPVGAVAPHGVGRPGGLDVAGLLGGEGLPGGDGDRVRRRRQGQSAAGFRHRDSLGRITGDSLRYPV